MGVTAIVGGVAAAATVASTAYGMASSGGGDMSGAYTQAGAMQAEAANRAAALEQQRYEETRADLAPWRTGGGAAESRLGGMLGLEGYAPIDATKTLAATPGYQWLQGQGVSALDRSAAGRGLALSGAQRKGITNYGQNLALTYAYNPYMANLQAMSGRGEAAAAQTGQFGMQGAAQQGGDYMAAANALANAQVQAAQAQYANSQSQMGNIMGGLGMTTGILGNKGMPWNTPSTGAATGGGGTWGPVYSSPGYQPGGYGYADWGNIAGGTALI